MFETPKAALRASARNIIVSPTSAILGPCSITFTALTAPAPSVVIANVANPPYCALRAAPPVGDSP